MLQHCLLSDRKGIQPDKNLALTTPKVLLVTFSWSCLMWNDLWKSKLVENNTKWQQRFGFCLEPYLLVSNLSPIIFLIFPSSALTLLVGRQQGPSGCKKLFVGLLVVMIWLELCTSYSSSLSPLPPLSVLQWNPEWRHSGTGISMLSWKVAVKWVSYLIYPTIC